MPISPSSINGYEFNSEAERKIYNAALESKYFNNTERYLFHSLHMAKTGSKKIKGEIDFVYLDSECILFLEVKGGKVKFDSGTNEWYVLGGTEKGDPFRQAYEALFYTRDILIPQVFDNKSISYRLAYGIGVLFPDSIKPKEFKKSSVGQMEFDPELIYDYDTKEFVTYIKKIKKYWLAHLQYKNRSGISHRETSIIARYFRQDLHFKIPVSDLLKKADGEAQRLTGMQMHILENLKYNPGKGGIVMGGPGTGKTFLAIELLRRLILERKRTIFVCYNKNLAEYLNRLVVNLNLDNLFIICNIHSLYKDPAFNLLYSAPVINSEDYWARDLPLQFSKNVVESKKGYYDYLIVDEGQDILNEYHFEALSLLLRGGLESGNWAIFLDKEFQNIYNSDADEYFNYMRELYPCFVTLLHLNCRNTLSTIQLASLQTGFPLMPCLRTDNIWKSFIRPYASGADLINKINDSLTKLESEGVNSEDITILCSEKRQLINLIDNNPNKFIESAFPNKGFINVSTIHGYKGLENKFILICGPEDYDPYDLKQMSLIFIGNTRAIAQSIFFINNKYHSIIADRISNLITN